MHGKLGPLYDMSLELLWKAQISTADDMLYDIDEEPTANDTENDDTDKGVSVSGTFKFEDISNGVKDHFECSRTITNSDLTSEQKEKLSFCLQEFETTIRDTIVHVFENELTR